MSAWIWMAIFFGGLAIAWVVLWCCLVVAGRYDERARNEMKKCQSCGKMAKVKLVRLGRELWAYWCDECIKKTGQK